VSEPGNRKEPETSVVFTNAFHDNKGLMEIAKASMGKIVQFVETLKESQQSS
jgi:hypothetical protein